MTYIGIAFIGIAFIGMAYIGMAYIGMTYIGMAYIGMTYIVMAYRGMAYVSMTYIVMGYASMTYIRMAGSSSLHSTSRLLVNLASRKVGPAVLEQPVRSVGLDKYRSVRSSTIRNMFGLNPKDRSSKICKLHEMLDRMLLAAASNAASDAASNAATLAVLAFG